MQELKFKVTRSMSKVKSMSRNDVAHLYALTNVPTKYQLCTPYSFQDKDHTRISEILPGQDFKGPEHHSKVKGKIKVTP